MNFTSRVEKYKKRKKQLLETINRELVEKAKDLRGAIFWIDKMGIEPMPSDADAANTAMVGGRQVVRTGIDPYGTATWERNPNDTDAANPAAVGPPIPDVRLRPRARGRRD